MTPLEKIAAVAGIIGAVAGVIALWPVLNPPVPTPLPLPQPSIPEIQDYSTGWIEGDGKSTPDYCDPQKAALEKKYPGNRIEMTYLQEQHKENRDDFGFKHDRYLYSCSFSAHPK